MVTNQRGSATRKKTATRVAGRRQLLRRQVTGQAGIRAAPCFSYPRTRELAWLEVIGAEGRPYRPEAARKVFLESAATGPHC